MRGDPPLHVRGHYGLGDNLHQRGLIRQLLKRHEVWLETSWGSIYHDMSGDALHLMYRPTRLRTQAKNAARASEQALFTRSAPPKGARLIHLSYSGTSVEGTKSKTILEAMIRCAPGTSYEEADYSLPVPDEWFTLISDLPITQNKPILIYRPLVARPEWRGNIIRNAHSDIYAQLFSTIRAGFFVVSVADLSPGKEWLIGPRLKADLELHAGELTFEGLSALFAHADLVYTSSGFGAVLGPAVGTPVVSVIGGYERPQWHNTKPDLYLGIGPERSCQCATSACRKNCPKTVDIPAASARIANFLTQRGLPVAGAPVSEIYTTEAPPPSEIGIRA